MLTGISGTQYLFILVISMMFPESVQVNCGIAGEKHGKKYI